MCILRSVFARLAGSGAVLLATLLPLLVAGAPARADTDVAGERVMLLGKTTQRASFGPYLRRQELMDLRFGQDAFWSPGVSGSYQQKGAQLRLQVDEGWLRQYESDWADAFRQSLEADGLAPETVGCEVVKARLKARAKHRQVKLKTKYEIHCRAEGDFGVEEATTRVRYRARGEMAAPSAARTSPTAGLGWNLPMLPVSDTVGSFQTIAVQAPPDWAGAGVSTTAGGLVLETQPEPPSAGAVEVLQGAAAR